MLKGVNLTLLVGTVTLLPVPEAVIDALTEIEVKNQDSGPSGFQLTFKLSTQSPLHTIFMLAGTSPVPILRVVIVVTVNGVQNVLIDGVMTNHQIDPGGENGEATLKVTGEDLTALMNLFDFSGIPYPSLPAEYRVPLMLAKYAMFGIRAMAIPSVLFDVPIPTNLIPSQKGTDLEYIEELAEKVGYVFYLEPGPEPGKSTAYWGPKIKIGVPQSPLNINMDFHTNVESLNFNFDNQSKGLPTVLIYNEATKAIVPVRLPDITPLNPPLGVIPPIPNRIRPVRGVSKYSPAKAVLIGLAKASKWSDAIKGNGTLDVLRYGKILKARRLVGVRGAGLAFEGLYYVSSVTHTIKRGQYKQSFTLVRNGLLSTVQNVTL